MYRPDIIAVKCGNKGGNGNGNKQNEKALLLKRFTMLFPLITYFLFPK